MPHRLCVSAPAPPVCCVHSRHCPRRSGLGGDVDGAFSLHRNGLLPDVAADRAREILSPWPEHANAAPEVAGSHIVVGCLTSTVLDMSKRFGRYEREVSFEAGGVCPFTRFDLDGTRTVLPVISTTFPRAESGTLAVAYQLSDQAVPERDLWSSKLIEAVGHLDGQPLVEHRLWTPHSPRGFVASGIVVFGFGPVDIDFEHHDSDLVATTPLAAELLGILGETEEPASGFELDRRSSGWTRRFTDLLASDVYDISDRELAAAHDIAHDLCLSARSVGDWRTRGSAQCPAVGLEQMLEAWSRYPEYAEQMLATDHPHIPAAEKNRWQLAWTLTRNGLKPDRAVVEAAEILAD